MYLIVIINWTPKMSQVACQVFYMHYLIYPSLELCELSAKEFELHFIYLTGMRIHWRLWRRRVAWSDLSRTCTWNAAYKKGRCRDRESPLVITELSVHRDTRPERIEGTRIQGRELKVGIADKPWPEPGQGPEVGSGVSLEGDQEEPYWKAGV